ncbi:hypothetical protein B0H14DRAFT_686233 [Mycena olivaceomarginata]|nr:hypothetical protein B0H14DRAFT_686233 [Mycena olivaceomarginata]
MMTYYIPLAVVGALPLLRPVGASPLIFPGWNGGEAVTVTIPPAMHGSHGDRNCGHPHPPPPTFQSFQSSQSYRRHSVVPTELSRPSPMVGLRCPLRHLQPLPPPPALSYRPPQAS